MRKFIAALLFALTGACVFEGGVVLSNVFDSYKDSPDSTYIETAAALFAVGLVFLVGGVLAIRDLSPSRTPRRRP